MGDEGIHQGLSGGDGGDEEECLKSGHRTTNIEGTTIHDDLVRLEGCSGHVRQCV